MIRTPPARTSEPPVPYSCRPREGSCPAPLCLAPGRVVGVVEPTALQPEVHQLSPRGNRASVHTLQRTCRGAGGVGGCLFEKDHDMSWMRPYMFHSCIMDRMYGGVRPRTPRTSKILQASKDLPKGHIPKGPKTSPRRGSAYHRTR